MKKQQILTSLALCDVGNYLANCPFSTDIGIVYLNPKNGTHWVAYIKQNYFHYYGCWLPQKLYRFTVK